MPPDAARHRASPLTARARTPGGAPLRLAARRPTPSASLHRRSGRARSPLAWLPVCALLAACSHVEPLVPAPLRQLLEREPPPAPEPEPQPEPAAAAADASIYRSAQEARIRHLEGEVARLQADLVQAEQAMIAIESGLRGVHGRADAVSQLAEARIVVERAAKAAPWRRTALAKARDKLDEAERQFQAGHSGSAVFFASRARRSAEGLLAEARQVASEPELRFVAGRRVNLRAGPSLGAGVLLVLERDTPVFPERGEGEWMLVRTATGPAGWIHASLLRGP
jgi:hypothetical protein